MSPNALDRTAAWLLTMNAQLLEDEGLGPDPPHRDRLRSKEELSQAEKVKLDLGREGGAGLLDPANGQSPSALCPTGGQHLVGSGEEQQERHSLDLRFLVQAAH